MAASAQMAFAAAVALLLVAQVAFACDTPPGGCKNCANPILAYARIPNPSNGNGLGHYFHFGLGVAPDANGDGGYTSTTFGGNLNYEYFYVKSDSTGSKKAGYSILDNLVPAADLPADIAAIDSYRQCCTACAQTKGCYFYAYYPIGGSKNLHGTYAKKGNSAVLAEGKPADKTLGVYDFIATIDSLPDGIKYRCNLLNYQNKLLPKAYAFDGDKYPETGARNPKVIVGGMCNPTMENDPHLLGARGTKYDFNGGLAQPYCLVTDKNMHVNVFLDGYKDTRNSTGSTKGLRTWIKEVGVIWREEGVEHKAHMVARSSKQQERGLGFLKSVTVDGVAIDIPALGETVAAPGNFKLKFLSQEKKHIFDVDHFSLSAGSVLEMDVRMRVAHPALQSDTDAQAHFNLGFTYIESTPAVHGVLGQTYRSGGEQESRVAKFRSVAESIKGPLVADGETGKGFLDGETKDYLSSSILSPDCKFSVFTAPELSSQVILTQ